MKPTYEELEKYSKGVEMTSENRAQALMKWEQIANSVRPAAWKMVDAQSRMIDHWAEKDAEGKTQLWRQLHKAGDELREALGDRGTLTPEAVNAN